MELNYPFLPPGYTINVGYNARGKQDNSGDIDIVEDGWEIGEHYPDSIVAWIPNSKGGQVFLKHRTSIGHVFKATVCASQQEALDLISARLCLGIVGEDIQDDI